MKARKKKHVPKPPEPKDKEMDSQTRRAVALIDTWLSDDSDYDEVNWPKLKEGLEKNRLSSRKLFHD